MARSLVVVLSTLLAFGCGKKSHSGGGSPPTEITFDEKSLPPIDDAGLAQAKVLARAAGEATAPEQQVLIRKDQTTDAKSKRDRKLAGLRADLQNRVRDWQMNCLPNHVKNGNGIEGEPVPGKTYKDSESNETTGARCPIVLKENTETTYTVQSFSKQPPAMNMAIHGQGGAEGHFNPADARIVGANSFSLSYSMDGQFNMQGNQNNSYSMMIGQGAMDSINWGAIELKVEIRDSEGPTTKKKLGTYRLTQAGREYVFTEYAEGTSQNSKTRYFIGNRELSRDDVRAMGEFPFDLED